MADPPDETPLQEPLELRIRRRLSNAAAFTGRGARHRVRQPIPLVRRCQPCNSVGIEKWGNERLRDGTSVCRMCFTLETGQTAYRRDRGTRIEATSLPVVTVSSPPRRTVRLPPVYDPVTRQLVAREFDVVWDGT